MDGGPGEMVRNLPCSLGRQSDYLPEEHGNQALDRHSKQAPLQFVIVGALLFILLLDIGPLVGIDANANAILTLLSALIFVAAHGYIALGLRNLIAFGLITIIISFASEAVGVATGLVFGKYHYTDLLGPKLLGVPPMIQIGYLATGYASVMMGRIILSLPRPVSGKQIVFASLSGALIMVSWDVAMDPYQSTVAGDWIWHDGGGYFGVPLHNYAGWFATVLTFMLVYHIFASRYVERPQEHRVWSSTTFWSLPVLYYALLAIGIIVTPLVGGVPLPSATPQNYPGTLEALEASMSLVAIFSMGTPVVLALCRLALDRTKA
jgi:uncharacterized membrane protein